jgi:serine/threonine protein phosphatase PrpC
MLTVVADGCPGHEGGKDASPSLIDEILREGARRMLAGALRAEVDAYIARFGGQRSEDGRRLVVPMATTRAGRCSPALVPLR